MRHSHCIDLLTAAMCSDAYFPFRDLEPIMNLHYMDMTGIFYRSYCFVPVFFLWRYQIITTVVFPISENLREKLKNRNKHCRKGGAQIIYILLQNAFWICNLSNHIKSAADVFLHSDLYAMRHSRFINLIILTQFIAAGSHLSTLYISRPSSVIARFVVVYSVNK